MRADGKTSSTDTCRTFSDKFKTAYEIVEPAKWLLKGGRNTSWLPNSQVVTRQRGLKSKACKAGTELFNFYSN